MRFSLVNINNRPETGKGRGFAASGDGYRFSFRTRQPTPEQFLRYPGYIRLIPDSGALGLLDQLLVDPVRAVAGIPN
jgi:hypothetical protein